MLKRERQIKIATFQTIQRDCKSRHFGMYFFGGKLASVTGLHYTVKAKCVTSPYLPLNLRISEDMLSLVLVENKKIKKTLL